MKKIIKKIHLWLSIPFGIVITLLCLSGAILIFETEIKEMSDRKTYFVEEVKENTIPLPELISIVKVNLPDSVSISSVTIPADAGRNYRLGIEGQGRTSITVDPYTGEIRGKIQPYEKGTFFSFVRRLHRWFLFDYKRGEFSWGKTITGVSTLAFVFILISGMVVWIPRTIKTLKRRLSVKLKKGGFRFSYDLHLAGGFYAFLFLLLFCLTGLTWSFNWYRDGVYKLFGAETVQQQAPPVNTRTPEDRENQVRRERPNNDSSPSIQQQENRKDERRKRTQAEASGEEQNRRQGRGENQNPEHRNREERRNYINWTACADIVTELKEKNPHFKTITVQRETASVANNHYGNTRASDRYTFNPRSGEITGVELAKDANRTSKLRGWLYALHVGSWGGIFTKILSFIACLTGASLPVTGYYIFYKKRSKKGKK